MELMKELMFPTNNPCVGENSKWKRATPERTDDGRCTGLDGAVETPEPQDTHVF